jgi:hypothetical protein
MLSTRQAGSHLRTGELHSEFAFLARIGGFLDG